MKKFSLKIKKKSQKKNGGKDSSLFKSLSSGVGWGYNRGNQIITSEYKDKILLKSPSKKMC